MNVNQTRIADSARVFAAKANVCTHAGILNLVLPLFAEIESLKEKLAASRRSVARLSEEATIAVERLSATQRELVAYKTGVTEMWRRQSARAAVNWSLGKSK